MTILKANKDAAKFISLPVEQGAGETDWKKYQPVFKTQYADIPVDTGASTATSLVADFSSSIPDVFPVDGDTVYIRQTADDTVFSHTVNTAVDTVEDNAWNVSTASFVQSFSVSAQDTNPFGVTFKPDGTKMYVIGVVNDSVYEYTLSTAWDVSTASFVQSFSVAAQDTNPFGVTFKPDGTKMYVVGDSSDSVYEYSLSTAWDVSTASFAQNFSVAAQDTQPYGVTFKPDGTKMYVVGGANDSVYEYSLSTTWDVSTASFVQSFSVNAQDTSPSEVTFKPDGAKMYVIGSTNNSVHEYTLNTAWDVSTASFVQSFSVATQDTTPRGVTFKPDGTKMYVVGNTSDSVHEYTLPTSLTLNLTNDGLSAQPSHAMLAHTPDVYTSMQSSSARCLSEDLTLYEVSSSVTVYSGLLPTGYEQVLADGDTVTLVVGGSPADVVVGSVVYGTGDLDITGIEYTGNSFSVSGQDSSNWSLFFKPDGSKMYLAGDTNNAVYEYNLAVSWDVSTISYVGFYGVSGQTTSPISLFFKPDGTKMYIISGTNDSVLEYSLSTPWNVSTSAFVQSFSVAGQTTSPYGLFFKPDGTKMFVGGATGGLYEYDLSIPWDISTANFSQSGTIVANIRSLFMSSDGERLLMTSSSAVYEYSMGVGWDVSTLTQEGFFSVSDTFLNPTGVFYNESSGALLFSSASTVYEYNTITVDPRYTPWQNTKVDFTYSSQAATPTAATIPNRTVQDTVLSQLYKDDGYIETTYEEVTTTGDRAFQYRLDNDEFTKVKQVNYNLWKGV